MLKHDHWCSECELEWECHDYECAGVSAMHCDDCEYEEDTFILEASPYAS
jgi:hypothetical protein